MTKTEILALRTLQKTGFVYPNSVKELKSSELIQLSQIDLVVSVLYLDKSETRCIKQINELIEELSEAEEQRLFWRILTVACFILGVCVGLFF